MSENTSSSKQPPMPTEQPAQSDEPQAWETQYTPANDFDEMVGPTGIRENWQIFLKSLNRLSAKDLQKTREASKRYLRENGVIYQVQEEVGGQSAGQSARYSGAHTNTWNLDPLPLLYTACDWEKIESGITQRAKLFQTIFQDLYGPQTLIAQGLIPSNVVYAHSGFIRQAIKTQPLATPLPLLACDFARDTKGEFSIIRDFMLSAPGAGHTLENRVLVSRLWPDAFRELNILRIATFFKNFKSLLNGLSPKHTETPCIVVLSTGPNASTYFEQAYLASYLGYHLVQSNDLTVQDGQVWLKSLAGLQRVDVILRYLPDCYCDPLELDPNPTLGVPGLLQAIRQGTVTVVNPIGASVLDNPGLYPFLPQVCQQLLGEPLILPSVDTWWCGQEAERKQVISQIDSMLIKSIDKHRKTVDGSCLSRSDRNALIKEIEKEPYRFVGQARLSFSSTPTFEGSAIMPCPTRQKVFAAATPDHQFMVLPGGIAKTLVGPCAEYKPFEKNTLLSPESQISKDIWVAAGENAKPDPIEPLDYSNRKNLFNTHRIKELESIVPSRAAEAMYWAGRYAERSESIARVLRCIMRDLNDHYEKRQDDAYLHILINSLVVQSEDQLLKQVSYQQNNSVKRAYDELNRYMSDRDLSGSLVHTIKLFTTSAFEARDLWSGDTWRTIDAINEARKDLIKFSNNRFRWQDTIDGFISLSMSFVGLISESMIHEDSWRMLEIGRKIEHISTQSKLLYYFFGELRDEHIETQISEAALIINESLIVQRRQYRDLPGIESVLELLIEEHRNPRGLVYQIGSLKRHISKLPSTSSRIRDNEALKLAMRCDTEVNLASMASLFETKNAERPALQNLLSTLFELTQQLNDVLSHTYFSHTQRSHQLNEQEFGVIKLV